MHDTTRTRKKMDRRTFLKRSLASGVAAATAAAAAPSNAAEPKAHPSKQLGMVIDLKKCIGCNACTISCKSENHTPPGVVYNVVLEEEVGEYPYVSRRFLPRPCMHCKNPSCTKVCPVGATYKREEDGIVVIDYDRCIGCRYCIAACPYDARYFDFGEEYNATPTAFDQSLSPEYGELRKRRKGRSPIGNTRKCTLCLHRIKKGLQPACVDTCLGRARYFGDVADKQGPLWQMISRRSHMRLREDLGNEPSVYYLL
ncbi:MAG: 4Fe-4S dicluster domain-containing protein [Candidatus Tectomicrobia bacterium]|nr:4Fe-4S dicluster domain-containing protein [Candidatus Tectomicrobia bacterium]